MTRRKQTFAIHIRQYAYGAVYAVSDHDRVVNGAGLARVSDVEGRSEPYEDFTVTITRRPPAPRAKPDIAARIEMNDGALKARCDIDDG